MNARAGDLSRMLRSWTAIPLYLRYGLPALAVVLAVAVRLEPHWSLVIPAPTAAAALLLLTGVTAALGLTHGRLRRAAAESARNEESLRLAQTCANEVAWDLDPRTGALRRAPELDRLYGVAKGSVTSYEAWRRLVHPEDVQRVDAGLAKALTSREPFEVEFRILDGSGEVRWFSTKGAAGCNERGEVVRVLGVSADITARKRAEEALRQALEQRQMALTAAGLGAWEWPGQLSKVVCDERCAYLLGFPARVPLEVETSELIARVHPDDRDPTLKIIRQAMKGTREEEYRSEFRILWPNGSWHWVALQGQAFFGGEQRRLVRLAGVIMDIAERKRAEEALREAQRTEGIALLAGGVAHEFNNILTALMGNIALAQGQLDPASEIRTNLGVAIDCCQRAAGLTRQLLAYAGKGAFVREPVSISEAAQGAVQLVSASCSKAVEIRADLAPGLPPILADPAQIRQALVNLIPNGAEAVLEEHPGVVSIRTSLRGGHVCIEVSDTGRGMDHETRQRILDPFFTTKFLGRGMGLPAVRGIVQALHGRIAVESELGKGTRIEVLLPSMEAPTPETETGQWAEPSGATGTVLIVDDEAPIRRMSAALLGNLGVTVIEASTGREAIACLQENPSVHVVLLDVVMPDMGGAETLPEIQRLRPGLPVIVSSGYAETEVKRRFGDREFTDFLPKPYTSRQLLECVLPVLARVRRNLRHGDLRSTER
jgi:PAS domain S-box-containing protein